MITLLLLHYQLNFSMSLKLHDTWFDVVHSFVTLSLVIINVLIRVVDWSSWLKESMHFNFSCFYYCHLSYMKFGCKSCTIIMGSCFENCFTVEVMPLSFFHTLLWIIDDSIIPSKFMMFKFLLVFSLHCHEVTARSLYCLGEMVVSGDNRVFQLLFLPRVFILDLSSVIPTYVFGWCLCIEITSYASLFGVFFWNIGYVLSY